MRINEVLTRPFLYQLEKVYDDQYSAKFPIADNGYVDITFENHDDIWWVSFSRLGKTPAGYRWSVDMTGQGQAFRIYATVISAMREFMNKEHPDLVIFDAAKDENTHPNNVSRVRLYRKLIKKYITGYKVFEFDRGDKVRFKLKLDQTHINTAKEN